MKSALVIETSAVAGMGSADGHGRLLVWLALEGIGYGAFLASSQAYIAEHTTQSTRGAAIGFYSMTGGVGNTAAPLVMGVIGGIFGLVIVFPIGAVLMTVGIIGILAIWRSIPGAMVAAGDIVTPTSAEGGVSS